MTTITVPDWVLVALFALWLINMSLNAYKARLETQLQSLKEEREEARRGSERHKP